MEEAFNNFSMPPYLIFTFFQGKSSIILSAADFESGIAINKRKSEKSGFAIPADELAAAPRNVGVLRRLSFFSEALCQRSLSQENIGGPGASVA